MLAKKLEEIRTEREMIAAQLEAQAREVDQREIKLHGQMVGAHNAFSRLNQAPAVHIATLDCMRLLAYALPLLN